MKVNPLSFPTTYDDIYDFTILKIEELLKRIVISFQSIRKQEEIWNSPITGNRDIDY